MDFLDISYLATGNPVQQQAYRLIKSHNILVALSAYDPIAIGTIPININIASSDLDISCCYIDAQKFRDDIQTAFGAFKDFIIHSIDTNQGNAIVCRFSVDSMPFEIFGQSVPTIQQLGYRHMINEFRILQKRGEDFRREIIRLKQHGHKTESAFAIALGLKGDPYEALLTIY